MLIDKIEQCRCQHHLTLTACGTTVNSEAKDRLLVCTDWQIVKHALEPTDRDGLPTEAMVSPVSPNTWLRGGYS